MRKIIQIVSLLSIVLTVATFSVKASNAAPAAAEIGFGTEVNIPFAFNIGDKAYEAGRYIVRVQKLPTGAAILSIRNPETDAEQTLFMNETGDGGTVDKVNLVFANVDGQRYLTKVRSQDKTFALIVSRDKKNAGGAAGSF